MKKKTISKDCRTCEYAKKHTPPYSSTRMILWDCSHPAPRLLSSQRFWVYDNTLPRDCDGYSKKIKRPIVKEADENDGGGWK